MLQTHSYKFSENELVAMFTEYLIEKLGFDVPIPGPGPDGAKIWFSNEGTGNATKTSATLTIRSGSDDS